MLTVALAVEACGIGDLPRSGSAGEAEAVVRAWLEAVRSDVGDSGWSLLHPLARSRLYGDNPARYVLDVAAIDWRGFRWHLGGHTRLDGNWRVEIVIEGDPAPAVALGGGRLIQLFSTDDGISRAIVTVLFEEGGVGGVLA